jgi:hypothetical protein
MMKGLFLDIDGVLNRFTTQEQDKCNGMSQHLEPELVKRLLAIRDSTQCRIILTSTWKGYELDRDKLVAAGIYRVGLDSQTKPITMTNAFDVAFKRGIEIEAWIKDPANPTLTQYAIVDDHDQFMGYQQSHYVKTLSHVGLTNRNAMALMHRLI